MASANSSLNIAEVDFDSIKNNFKTFLKSQSQFADYNFEGSVISSVLDLLAYNTHYNAMYLNMVANEMFLDTSLKRSSVVSHSKLLNYTPISAKSSKAVVGIEFTGVISPTFTIPKYTKFYSESINNVNYPFVTLKAYSVNTLNNSAIFPEVELFQGQVLTYSYTANLLQNPTSTFKIPDGSLDLSTLLVRVYDSAQSTTYTTYDLSTNHLTLSGTSPVYFVQESLDGYYELYFGDGILGKSLISGNVVVIEYVSSNSDLSNGAKNFTLMYDLGSYTNVLINTILSAYGGSPKESIESIKYNAPKSYASQNRAVTKSDYIQLLSNDKSIIPIDAINIWGGEEQTPPQYGKLFLCIKPKGGYGLTASQKYRLINEVIKPFSIITVIPEIVDVDYTFVKISSNVLYDKASTTYSEVDLQTLIKANIISFCNSTLNSFDSMFIFPDLISMVKNSDKSVITSESTIRLQKRFSPIFNMVNSITFNFNVSLKKNSFLSDIFSYFDETSGNIISNVTLEEAPTISNIVEEIQIVNPGSGYITPPTISILGDGSGAIATAELTNGQISSITVLNSGLNYTQAVVIISGGGGAGATAVPILSGNSVKIRSIYYVNGIKTILQDNVGEISYIQGTVTLTKFNPYELLNPLGYMSISVEPSSTIFYSTQDKILSLDLLDNSSINITLTQKV